MTTDPTTCQPDTAADAGSGSGPEVSPVPAPLITRRTTETRGIWLSATPDPATDAGSAAPARAWIPESTLEGLDAARECDGFETMDYVSWEEPLLAAGLAVVVDAGQGGDACGVLYLRGTEKLRVLLHPETNDRGAPTYVAELHGPFYGGEPGTEIFEEAAEAAGYLRCLNCQAFPVEYWRNRHSDNELSVEYDNALEVTFSGGYGMFIDRAPVKSVLCHECAHLLVETFPGLVALLEDPVRGHAHTSTYQAANPDHQGYDTQVKAPQQLPEPTPSL